jgi:hypothetical protein
MWGYMSHPWRNSDFRTTGARDRVKRLWRFKAMRKMLEDNPKALAELEIWIFEEESDFIWSCKDRVEKDQTYLVSHFMDMM